MLVLIGLGLGDPQDITLKGLDYLRRSDKAYLEIYTSILSCGKSELVRLRENCQWFLNKQS
jgi:diphthine synthase